MQEPAWSFWLPTIFTGLALSVGAQCIYRLYLHPLAKFPGPPLWATSRFFYLRAFWSGRYSLILKDLHQKYGDIVRTAPDELSFANAAAWPEIYGTNSGNGMDKSSVWHITPKDQTMSIINTLDNKEHARVRKAVLPGFTERSLRAQEDIVQHYVNLLIQRLRGLAQGKGQAGPDIDIAKWFNFITFDIIGDLAYGESFNCLQTSTYHEWVALIYSFFKAISLGQSLNFYPKLARILSWYVPKSLMEGRQKLMRMSDEKVERRLELEKSNPGRPDIIGQIKVKEGDGKDGVTTPELYANSTVFITAGSETTAGVLSGLMDYLLRNPDKLNTLTQEIRAAFANESEITFQSAGKPPYLDAVIQEGLRLCNPVPLGLPRQIPPKGASVCSHWLPGGTHVCLHALTVTRSSKYFHHPDDFVPERWLPETKASSDSPFRNDILSASQPFGVGARNCIGKQLALYELRLILARLVFAFDIVDSYRPRQRWEERKAYFLVDKGDTYVKLNVRK